MLMLPPRALVTTTKNRFILLIRFCISSCVILFHFSSRASHCWWRVNNCRLRFQICLLNIPRMFGLMSELRASQCILLIKTSSKTLLKPIWLPISCAKATHFSRVTFVRLEFLSKFSPNNKETSTPYYNRSITDVDPFAKITLRESLSSGKNQNLFENRTWL